MVYLIYNVVLSVITTVYHGIICGLLSQARLFIYIMSQRERDHGSFMVQYIPKKIGHMFSRVLITMWYDMMYSGATYRE